MKKKTEYIVIEGLHGADPALFLESPGVHTPALALATFTDMEMGRRVARLLNGDTRATALLAEGKRLMPDDTKERKTWRRTAGSAARGWK